MSKDTSVPARRRFRPPLWAWLLVSLLLALMISLGFWQLERADEKQALLEAYEAAGASDARPMPEPAEPATAAPEALRIEGRYREDGHLLLDNQLRNGRLGVRVWTPFERHNGEIVLVDRGWIPAPERDEQPDVSMQTLPGDARGYWRRFPQSGFAVDNAICGSDAAIHRVQYPAYEELACRYDAPLARGLLLLDPQEPEGFLREWQPVHLDPSVHWGYALQWFGFAIALIVIFIVTNRKPA